MKQSAAAAASAALQSCMFIMSGVVVLVSAVAALAMGYGPWFTLLAGIQLAVSAFGCVVAFKKQRLAAARAHVGGQEMPAIAKCTLQPQLHCG